MYEKVANISVRSDRLQIRQFDRHDIEDFVSFMIDPESTKFLSFNENQKSREGATELLEANIESYSSTEPMMAFAVEDRTTKRFVGFCGLTSRDDDAVEIMYAVVRSEGGKGYAAEIAAALAQHATNLLRYERVIAPISPENKASIAVAEKAGFEDRGISKYFGGAENVCRFVFEQTNG